MKEKIEAKINEFIEHILSKPVEDVTYNDYIILDSKLNALKAAESNDAHRKEMVELMGKIMTEPIMPTSTTSLIQKEDK